MGTTSHTEIELKLQVPRAARAAVQAAVATASAGRTHLQALYFDTDQRHLAAAGIALRLRREGRAWVQTLKCGPAHGLQRLEHNVRLPPGAPCDAHTRTPALDLQRHAGSAAGDALARALQAAGGLPLRARFGTDVWRQHRVQRQPGGRVELALDRGHLQAGARRLPLWELEIEQLAGPPTVVTEAAARWVQRHGLWLDLRSKAERGEMLARGEAMSPAVKARHPRLTPQMTVHDAWTAVLQACLAQLLPNASQIASGEHTDEHVHQLRVGLRRLRAAQRLFQDRVVPLPEATQAALAQLFEVLGRARDAGVAVDGLADALQAAGLAPEAPVPRPAGPTPTAVTREPGVNLAWLDLLARAHAPAGPGDGEPLAEALLPRLQHWHARLCDDARRWRHLDDEARHRLRKRLKRLRYALEFMQALLPARRWAAQLKALAHAQEALGRCTDLAMALARLRAGSVNDPARAFAVRWLLARQAPLGAEAGHALARWRRAPTPWKP